MIMTREERWRMMSDIRGKMSDGSRNTMGDTGTGIHHVMMRGDLWFMVKGY